MAKVVILYASQTGTAKSYAKQLASEIGVQATNIADFDVNTEWAELSEESPVFLFVTSTSEGGNPPESMEDFYHTLKEWQEDGAPTLNDLKYSCFGIGNSNYKETYQAVFKFLTKAITSTGAQEVIPSEQGDVSCNIDEQFNLWKEKIKAL